jgi:hypothetical protein
VCDIEKNGRETLRIELDEFQGRQLITARTCCTDKAGALKPTPKGLTVDVKRLSALRAAIEEPKRIAREAGLLPVEDPRPASEVARDWAAGRRDG